MTNYMTFQELLDKCRNQAFSERDKGDRFERLMQGYLQTDPTYAHLFKKVWLWDKFPGRKDLGGQDTGIDLVALTHEGDYWAIPSVIYIHPELASVGSTEEQAEEEGISCETLSLPLAFSGRFVAENERGNGLCKIVVEKTTRKILGASILGSPASEMIYGMAMAIENEWTVEQVQKTVFPHPTVSEIIKETLWSNN